jgi:Tfp pilus assembly protein PilN
VTQPNLPGAETTPAATAVLAPPRLPRVNLMPPEIAEAAAFRRFQMAMGAAILAAVAVVGVLYVHEHGTVSSAKQQLATEQSQSTQLQARLNSLSSVRQVYTHVAQKQAMLAEAMGAQVKWSDYLTDLSLKVPEGVWLTNMAVTENAGPGGTATSTTTDATGLVDPGIGQVTFTGTAFSHDQVAAWLDMLSKERGWADPYFTSSVESAIGAKSVVNFSAQATLKPAAQDGRFAPKTGN